MTRAEIATELLRAARASEDLAESLVASARHHRAEYEACIRIPAPQVTFALHERALELYPHVVANDQEAQRLLGDAAVFREAAEIIGGKDG